MFSLASAEGGTSSWSTDEGMLALTASAAPESLLRAVLCLPRRLDLSSEAPVLPPCPVDSRASRQGWGSPVEWHGETWPALLVTVTEESP